MNSKILAECASFEVLECKIADSIFLLSIIYNYAFVLIYWNMSKSCCFCMPQQFVFLRCFNKRSVSIFWIFKMLNKYSYPVSTLPFSLGQTLVTFISFVSLPSVLSFAHLLWTLFIVISFFLSWSVSAYSLYFEVVLCIFFFKPILFIKGCFFCLLYWYTCCILTSIFTVVFIGTVCIYGSIRLKPLTYSVFCIRDKPIILRNVEEEL